MGGIRRQKIEGEAVAKVVVKAAVIIVWFIGCGRSIKGY